MGYRIVGATICLALCTSAWALDLNEQRQFDIPAQKLSTALVEFSRQANAPIVSSTHDVERFDSRGVTGRMSLKVALKALLEGTGLEIRTTESGAIAVGTFGAGSRAIGSAPADATHVAQLSQDPQVASPQASTTAGSVQSAGAERPALSEIIVTAQKRDERLQDVPVPVTVLDVGALAENDQNRLQDYFATVPGLNLTAGGLGGEQTLFIRGISTGASTNPTVAVTIDDVPFGSSSSSGLGSQLYPDIDPSDLQRIEVLRGPQGTLYGASSIGGLIKFVTLDPSTDAVSGRVQVLGDDVEHGGVGYGVRGAVNVPLSDTFAVRASAFTRRDPGYIDNATTGRHDVNEVDTTGGRLSALWRPSDAVSLKLGALLQNTDGYGSPAVDTNAYLQPTFGDLTQERMPGTEAYTVEARLYSATLTAKFAGIDFTSVSGYAVNKYDELGDYSLLLGSLAESTYDVAGASARNYFETEKFTQEFRLSSSVGQRLDWLAGAFYTHESTPANQTWFANEPTTGAAVGELINYSEPSTVMEYALFADLTVHFTDQFDVQFGGRESEYSQTYNETDSGPLAFSFDGASPYVQPAERTDGNAFTYLLTPRLKLSPDLMVYARFASGYRVGGPNTEAALLRVPLAFAPDKTNNYEVGVKGDVLDRALTFDASAYYIDWKHIQLFLMNPYAGYWGNGGTAKSQGLELSLQSRPLQGLSITAAVSINDAVLTQNLPASSTAIGFDGDRLPYSSRFSGSLSADQDIALPGNVTGFVGASLMYVGDREGEFITSPTQVRLFFPAYAQTNIHAGARYQTWTVNLFVNNLTDKRGIVGGGISYAGSGYYATYIQPRTAGLSITKSF
jgi:iron complex outermembrane receptor protein